MRVALFSAVLARHPKRAHSAIAVALLMGVASAGAFAQNVQVQQRVVGKLVTHDDLDRLTTNLDALERRLSEELASNDAELRRLRDQITRLQVVVEHLTAEKKSTKGGWSDVHHGLREGEVRALLGEPRKTITGILTHWFYSDRGYAGAHVVFRDGEVFNWTSP